MRKLIAYLDIALFVGHGKSDADGHIYTGIKDICDSLKNIVLVGTLLVAVLAPMVSHIEGNASYSRYWPTVLAAPMLLLLFFLLLIQTLKLITHFPGCRTRDSHSLKPIVVLFVALLAIGLFIGLMTLGVLIASTEILFRST